MQRLSLKVVVVPPLEGVVAEFPAVDAVLHAHPVGDDQRVRAGSSRGSTKRPVRAHKPVLGSRRRVMSSTSPTGREASVALGSAGPRRRRSGTPSCRDDLHEGCRPSRTAGSGARPSPLWRTGLPQALRRRGRGVLSQGRPTPPLASTPSAVECGSGGMFHEGDGPLLRQGPRRRRP